MIKKEDGTTPRFLFLQQPQYDNISSMYPDENTYGVAIHPEKDIGVIAVPYTAAQSIQPLGIENILDGNFNPKPDDVFYGLGFTPHAKKSFGIYPFQVSGLFQTGLEGYKTDMGTSISPGISGTSLFNNDGQVVAIASSVGLILDRITVANYAEVTREEVQKLTEEALNQISHVTPIPNK